MRPVWRATGLAQQHGICHSLILIWAEKYRQGALTLDVQREERLQDYELKTAAYFDNDTACIPKDSQTEVG